MIFYLQKMSEKSEEMDKLLLAEPDDLLRNGLLEALRRQYDVVVCTNGRMVLELLQTTQPKVAIIDLSLTELDGLYVIEQALDVLPPIVLCVTDFCNDYIVQTLQDLGIDYVFRRPCQPQIITARLEHLSSHVPVSHPLDLQSITCQHLLSLRLPPQSDGFLYLKIAIPMYFQDPSQLLCKEIYGTIVRICNLSGWKVVERSIRRVIQDAWKQSPHLWETWFPDFKEPPTNKAFICRIAQLLEES